MKNFILTTTLCASLLLMACGCGSVGSVSTTAAADLASPMIQRVEAYIASPPMPAQIDVPAYRAAAAALLKLGQENPEHVPAATGAPLVQIVADTHDALVTADSALDAVHRSTYLRSSAILRSMFSEALKGLDSK